MRPDEDKSDMPRGHFFIPAYNAQVSGATFTDGGAIEIHLKKARNWFKIYDEALSVSSTIEKIKSEYPDKEIKDIKIEIKPSFNITQNQQTDIQISIENYTEIRNEVEFLEKDIINNSEEYKKVIPEEIFNDLLVILEEIKTTKRGNLKKYLKSISGGRFFKWLKENKRLLKDLPRLLSFGSMILGMII